MVLDPEIVIDLDEPGIVECRRSYIGDEVDCGPRTRRVRLRPELKQVARNRVRYLRPFGIGGHTRRTHRRVHLPETFPGPEEERLVAKDRTAYRRAVLVAVQRVLRAA